VAHTARSDGGREPVEVWFWRAEEVELVAERTEYAWLDPNGEEVVAAELLAEMGPLTGGARLCLFGTQGYVEAFRIDDALGACCEQVARCWMGVAETLVAGIGDGYPTQLQDAGSHRAFCPSARTGSRNALAVAVTSTSVGQAS
jgi:hypothetical protein